MNTANTQTVPDPLLACILTSARLLNLTIQPDERWSSVAAAGKLSPETYTELALSCGLIATWVDVKIKTIVPAMLPAIVSLKDGRAVILTDISSDRSGFVVTHSDESVTSLTYEKLSALADEKILLLKAAATPALEPLNPTQADAVHWFGGTLWRFRHFYIDSMLATVMANVLTLASIFFTMNVYNRIVPTQAYASLWTLAIGTTLAIIFEFLMRWLKARLIDIGGKKADLAINATLLREIMTIRLEHRPNSIGVFASSMRDFDALRDFFSSASLVLVTDLPFIFLFEC